MRVLLALLVFAACATTQTPRTLGKGVTAVGLSVGGPVARIPGVGNIPLPYAIVEGRHGVTDRLDVLAATHLLLDAFGTPSLDLGASYLLVPERLPDRSAATVSGRLMILANPEAPIVLPEATLTWSYRAGSDGYLYGGLDAVLGRGESLSAGEPRGPLLLMATPFLGGQAPLGARLHLGLEAGWIAPYIDTTDSVVLYPLPGGPGAISFKLGLSYRFGRRQ